VKPLAWFVAAAVACGAQSTPATPEVKATTSAALGSMQAASTALSAIDSLVGTAHDASIGSPSAGFPAMPANADVNGETSLDLMFDRSIFPAVELDQTVGCLDAATRTLVPPDGSTCTASDHLEITFGSGDVAHYKSDAAASSNTVWITAGAWEGTSFVLTEPGPTEGTVKGVFRYQSRTGELDVDVDASFAGIGTVSGATGSIEHFTLTAVDHLANVAVDAHWSQLRTDAAISVSGGETFATSVAPKHSIAINFQLEGAVKRDPSSGFITSATAQASGDVLWDQKEAGVVAALGIAYLIGWNDGTTAPLGLPRIAVWQ
jgi:hypothetical protein